MQKELRNIIVNFKEGENIQPLLVSESDMISIVNFMNESDIEDISELRENIYPNVYLFETEEKTFKIEKTREIIEKASIKTQYDFNIFIIREIDKLSDQAANSLLKLLEDVPARLLFLLTTKTKENIIETIRSRILYFGSDEVFYDVTSEQRNMINDFFNGEKSSLIRYMMNSKIQRNEYISIMEYMLKKLKHSEGNEKAIGDLIDGIRTAYNTNANPKYILDLIILEL